MNLFIKTILLFTSLGCLYTIITGLVYKRKFLNKTLYIFSRNLFNTISIIEPLLTGCLAIMIFSNDNQLIFFTCIAICLLNFIFTLTIYEKYIKLRSLVHKENKGE